jgi:hypothetical protein
MNLERAAESLREQFPAGRMSALDRREQRIEKFGALAFSGFMCVFVLAVLGLIYAVLDRMVFSGENVAVGLLLMGIIIFCPLMLMYVFFREDLKAKRKQAANPPPAELEMPVVTGRLIEEREFEPVPAVTEETTNLLPTPRNK